MSLGPVNHTQPEFTEAPVLDGNRLSGSFRPVFTPTTAPHILNMGKGIVVQKPLLEDDDPEDAHVYEIAWPQRVSVESDWRVLRQVQALGLPVWYIPYSVEMEAFIAAVGANTWKLSRPLASAKYASFETGTYASAAWVDGVAQTIVDTGTPTSGEIKISGDDDIETPSLTAGQKVTVAYYPAYPVVIPRLPKTLLDYNDMITTVVALEVTKQVPS